MENQNQMWMGMFEKLAAYKIQHKNTIVPQQYEKDPELHSVDIIKMVTFIRIESSRSFEIDWFWLGWS